MATISAVLVFVLASLAFHCDVTLAADDNLSRSPGNIYLESGRYKSVLVAVDQAVEFHENVLSHLKEYFRRASDVLYEATKPVAARRFGEITILFPRSWPHLAQCQSVSTENQNAANFIVEKETYQWGSNPHTQKIDSQCGTPGKTVYLPHTFVIDESEAKKYGENIGKTMVHEWGHLRYGLFDELEEIQDPVSCVLFDNGLMRPIKCSTEVQGTLQMANDGKSCNFEANLKQPEDVKASLMYLPYLDTVSTFCNKTGKGITHNRAVANPQNNFCNGKSAWEVMMDHPDFQHHKESVSGTADIQFRCVQERDVDRMVLVMDVSGSMQEEHRIQRMQRDVQLFLESLPCRDTSIGMVEFSTDMDSATITHKMARLKIGDNLAHLISAIPNRTLEHTCIGCGIRRAIQLVESSNSTVNGTVLAVFTDGQENMRPYIDEVKDEVISRGIVVYGILLMTQAKDHPLIRLSTQTGGKACIFSDSQHTSYYDCLNGILHHRSPLTAPNLIYTEQIRVDVRSKYSAQVIIDSSIQDHVSFVISWSTEYLGGCEDTVVTLTSPDNKTVDQSNQARYVYTYNLRTITIDVSGFQPGWWTFNLNNIDHLQECLVRVMVERRQLIDDCSSGVLPQDVSAPILLFPTIDSQKVVISREKNPLDNAVKLYVEVRKGQYAVLDAQVEADIENDKGQHWTVPLYDNGIGADAVANDGVYSRYFTGFDKDGTYTATFNVVGTDQTKTLIQTKNLNEFAAQPLPQYRYERNTTYGKIDKFQRTKVAGFFEVVNYTQIANNSLVETTIYPPPKIVDLKVTSVQRLTGAISLQWTAVGNILDHGAASHYDLRISTSAEHLRDNFESAYLVQPSDVVSGQINQAKEVGHTESFVISPQSMTFEINQIYYVAVKTVSSYGLKSPVSNVVLFQFLNPVTTKRTTTTTKSTTQKKVNTGPWNTDSRGVSIGGFVHQTTQAVVSGSGEEEDKFPVWVYYVIAGLGGALLLTILILCMVCCTRPSKSKSANHSGESNHLPQQTVVGPDGLTVSPDALILDVMESGVGSDQEPDLIKEINEKDLAQGQARPGKLHSTWPESSKVSSKHKKKHANNIFRSIGKSHFFTEMRKKLTFTSGSSRNAEKEWNSKPGGSQEPLQNVPYSNPLFGNSVIISSITVPPQTVADDGTSRHEDVIF